MSATLDRARFIEASRAYHARGWVVCPECEGVSFFYSDSGPSGREYPCDECDGNGGWWDEASTLRYMSPRTIAGATGDHAAIGRPFGQPAGGLRPEPAPQSQPKALVRRIVEGTALTALTFTLCFALPAIFGGLQ